MKPRQPSLFDHDPIPVEPQTRGLVRRTDPDTSRDAADLANVSGRAAAVAEIMKDGKPRIDEEIHSAMDAKGPIYTRTSICHGRKTLLDLGFLVLTGQTRETVSGRQSREYVWSKEELT